MSAAVNSTKMPSGPSPGAEGLQIYGLPYLQSALTRYRPEADILFCIALYSPLLAQTFAYSSPKFTRARGYTYLTVVVHVLSSLPLVIRYHARHAILRVWPSPDTTDLALFAASILTSFRIEARRAGNQRAAYRASFHAGFLMFLGVFAASWVRGRDPGLFRVTVTLFNWFAWFRWAVRMLPVVDPRFRRVKDFGVRMEVGLLLSLSLALSLAGYPYGVPLQLGLTSIFMLAERAIAKVLSSYPDNNLFKKVVLTSGYVDFEYLKEQARQSTTDSKAAVEENGTKVDM
ncbi:hypothetical protein VMCG_04195 [Cytospora schulzeri]|uniref:Uncharacterized protein n=1 Tax=Cytospora schulzeri TaxID=448051 RepID=A0A423WTM6_9PEZI|nr:hypothetical protein VMCG_04195 [Valsa malicola]